MSAGSSMEIVRGENIHLSFGMEGKASKVDVLNGVDIRILQGESIGLVGPSGSGKTSLMMVLGGLEKATKGKIVINGENIAALNEDKLTLFRRENVGIVFQHFHLMTNMTALENVILPLGIRGFSDTKDRAKEALSRVGLENRFHHYPQQLSGGEQQRVAIARAFVGAPKLLFADEPTGNLDAETGLKVRDMIFEHADEKKSAILLITHDMGLVKLCSRRLTMRDGVLNEGGET